jgi:hypothetical protein
MCAWGWKRAGTPVGSNGTARQDAHHILDVLRENRFPQIWIPSWDNRDLRQRLWQRHRLVQMRTRVMKSTASHSPERRPAP